MKWELTLSATCGYLCLCLGFRQLQANKLLGTGFKLRLLQGWRIPPCPSDALLVVRSGSVSSLFKL